MLDKRDCETLRDRANATMIELTETLDSIKDLENSITAMLCVAKLNGIIDALLNIIGRLE